MIPLISGSTEINMSKGFFMIMKHFSLNFGEKRGGALSYVYKKCLVANTKINGSHDSNWHCILTLLNSYMNILLDVIKKRLSMNPSLSRGQQYDCIRAMAPPAWIANCHLTSLLCHVRDVWCIVIHAVCIGTMKWMAGSMNLDREGCLSFEPIVSIIWTNTLSFEPILSGIIERERGT